jgi:hypothetical protein
MTPAKRTKSRSSSAVDDYLAAHPASPLDQIPGIVTYLSSLRPEDRQRHRAELLDMVNQQNRAISK